MCTHQQNEIAQRKNAHLLEQTRALLFQYHVPKSPVDVLSCYTHT